VIKIDAQLWSDLFWISGGMLELPKCSYHQIQFDFLPSGKPYMRAGQVTNEIYLQNIATNATIPITSKSVFDPHKTLGHQRAPMGKGKIQLKELRQKSNTMARQVSSSPLNRRESRTFFNVIYLNSINHTLPPSNDTSTSTLWTMLSPTTVSLPRILHSSITAGCIYKPQLFPTSLGTRIDQMGNPFGHISIWSSS
jgi:hypothetical protein